MLSFGGVAQAFVEEDENEVLFFSIMNNTKIGIRVVEFVIGEGGFFGCDEGDGGVENA